MFRCLSSIISSNSMIKSRSYNFNNWRLFTFFLKNSFFLFSWYKCLKKKIKKGKKKSYPSLRELLKSKCKLFASINVEITINSVSVIGWLNFDRKFFVKHHKGASVGSSLKNLFPIVKKRKEKKECREIKNTSL